ncbi:outer membrane beta-barrel family protein [Hufsiella ginkgonis]|uniref:TonB-dependent receptor n=1 Tax=Hufsiella ginkgonis TaxID=2695274 RepID=A0A7K1XVC7_9SPHI|nr:outer membrane beta-barrel family protein [Hufsiella ginkgonis]MXV14932.1 TonB-dependent receptor [Hufsiella ginkgonis]
MKTNRFKRIAVLIYVSTYINIGFAQTGPFTIKGRMVAEKKISFKEVTLQLVRAADSALVKTDIADESGNFAFELVPAGDYRVRISHIGLQTYRSAVVNAAKADLGTIQLRERTSELKEVAITGQKPFIQQQFDKTVLNVESSIVSAGSTAMEVLEKAPGITVDQNDNIKMRGRQGVQVMIDGKLVPMSGAELATMLRGMSSNAIEKIELVTNPSARYDASGNSGIIDIRLKKDKRNGTNGSLSASLLQGKYNKANSGLTLNHRNKKVNLFGSYNYIFRREFTDLAIYRDFDESGNFTGADDQANYFKARYNTHNYRAGLDYNVSAKTTVGFTANGFNLNIDRNGDNQSTRINAQHTASSYAHTASNSTNGRFNPGLNLNLRQRLDQAGKKELSVDLDYARYNTNDDQNYVTTYRTAANTQEKPDYHLYGDLHGHLSIRSAKADYAQPLNKTARLEAGLKSSWVSADNNLSFYDRSNGNNILDMSKSNHFLYQENINAAYVNISSQQKKWTLQGGLRIENTNSEGEQLNGGDSFDRSYVQLFPSGYAGYKFNNKHELGISVSRRINRPTYNQLNPFKYYINASTYNSGNPFLKPELTYSVEVTHTINQSITTKYSYSHTTDNMISVLSPDKSQANLVIQTDRNLASLNYYGVSVSAPVHPAPWLTSTNNLNFYYGLYSGNLVNTHLHSGTPTFGINSSNAITINAGLTAEVAGVYQTKEVYAFMTVRPIWSVSAGLQQQLWNRKASVKLNLADVFYTSKTRAVTRSTGYVENFYQQRDSRVATLNFTYRFGRSPSSAPRRVSGAEDEKRRAG